MQHSDAGVREVWEWSLSILEMGFGGKSANQVVAVGSGDRGRSWSSRQSPEFRDIECVFIFPLSSLLPTLLPLFFSFLIHSLIHTFD